MTGIGSHRSSATETRQHRQQDPAQEPPMNIDAQMANIPIELLKGYGSPFTTGAQVPVSKGLASPLKKAHNSPLPKAAFSPIPRGRGPPLPRSMAPALPTRSSKAWESIRSESERLYTASITVMPSIKIAMLAGRTLL